MERTEQEFEESNSNIPKLALRQSILKNNTELIYHKKDLQITICSGSNLAHGSVAWIGHHLPYAKINVLWRRPKDFSKTIVGTTERWIWKYKGELKGNIQRVSDDPAEVIPGSQIVIICSPLHVIGEILDKIKDHLSYQAMVGSWFGSGAFDLQALHFLGERVRNLDLTVFALQFVPFLCKATEYGKSVEIYGPKNYLCVAAHPTSRCDRMSNLISILYSTPTVALPNFLWLTLTPSNQIIHPGRVYGYFKDWDGKTGFDPSKLPKLYAELDDASADTIQSLDDEIQAIKKEIVRRYPQIDMSPLQPIKQRISDNYKDSIKDFSTLKSVFNTNDGYSKNVFPTLPHPDGKSVVLNTKGRFFYEDVPYGLVILKDIGDMLGVSMKNTEKIIKWHQKFMTEKYMNDDGTLIQDNLHLTGAPSKYGIKNAYQLCKSSLPELFTISRL